MFSWVPTAPTTGWKRNTGARSKKAPIRSLIQKVTRLTLLRENGLSYGNWPSSRARLKRRLGARETSTDLPTADRFPVSFSQDGPSEGGGLSGRNQRILLAVLLVTAAAVVFAWVQLDNAVKSIQFDLRKIGESLYEAHSKSGRWPAQIADLEGTQYLSMPHRRRMLEGGFFAVV